VVAVLLKVCGVWATPAMYGVTTYPVIALKPLLAGAVQVTVAAESPAAAVPMVGAPGSVKGTTAVDCVLAGPVPIALTAATVKV
jgi:hypothetical protein